VSHRMPSGPTFKPVKYHEARPAYPKCRIYCNQCHRRIRHPAMMCYCETKDCSGVLIVFCASCAGVADVQPPLFTLQSAKGVV